MKDIDKLVKAARYAMTVLDLQMGDTDDLDEADEENEGDEFKAFRMLQDALALFPDEETT